MNDSQILDWIEQHVEEIFAPLHGGIEIQWTKNGRDRKTTGSDLRDAVRKAAVETAVKGGE